MDFRRSLVFILDQSHRVVYFNSEAKNAYPDMELGKSCKEATGHANSSCDYCPLINNEGCLQAQFIDNLKCFVAFSVAEIEYPGHGHCHVITGSYFSSLQRELLSRVKFMNSFDFILEINLSANKYSLRSDRNYGHPLSYEEESFTTLLERIKNTTVHPDDKDRFSEFTDTNTIWQRLEEANTPISAVFKEKSSSGGWDDVYLTFIPENSLDEAYKTVFCVFKSRNNRENSQFNNDRNRMTGLYTENAFLQYASDFMEDFHEEVCLISIDIKHFRFYNKWYSRWQGDRLLKSIAAFLTQMDRLFSSVSGYGGGDNFFIICDHHDAVLNYLTEGLNELVAGFDGIEGFGLNYGGYVFENKEIEILDAIDYAETALKRNQMETSGKILWYDQKMMEEFEDELKILPDFERALDEKEFTFYLQPKCSISENKIVGAEALVRWIHKIRGFISPGEFVPVLEKNGLITRLDSYIWEEVCRKIRYWLDNGIEPVPISVNVSRIDIFNLNVPAIFENLIKAYEISPEYIEIEITESAFVDDQKIINSVINSLRKSGFKILIDDFGSGYSSLNMLKDVPADVLKMDIKFFDLNEANFEKGRNIISSVIEMSHSINVPVIAEGVETGEQIDLLKSLGLNYVQGYYYYKPLPYNDFEGKIKDPEKVSYSGIFLKK